MNNTGVTGLTAKKKEFEHARGSHVIPPTQLLCHTTDIQRTDNKYNSAREAKLTNRRENCFKLGKWFPLQGERAHSLNFCLFECMLIERKRRERLNNNYRAINFPRLYNSSQTTSPQPNTNFYHTQSIIMSTLYLYTYIIYYELFYSQHLLLK